MKEIFFENKPNLNLTQIEEDSRDNSRETSQNWLEN